MAPPYDTSLPTLVPLPIAVVGLLFVGIGARVVQTARRFLRTAAYRAAVHEARIGRPRPGVVPLAAAAALDVVFVLGLRSAPSRPDEAWAPWYGLPLHVLALTLPLVLLVLVVVALTSPPGAGRAAPHWLTRLQVATVATAGLGLAVYLSPWGRAGIAAVLQT